MNRSRGSVAAITVFVVALMSCLLMAGCAGQTGSVDSAITVSATASADVTPDKAALTVTVAGSGDTREAAFAAARNSGQAMMDRLKALGVAENKMNVIDENAVERFGEFTYVSEPYGGFMDEFGNWIPEGVNEYFYDGSGDIVGYDATCKVIVAEVDAGSLGQVAREAASAGATALGDLSFTVSNCDAAYQQALSSSVDAAHVKAEALAKASGVYVGRLVNLVENSTGDFESTVKDESNSLRIDDESTFDMTPTKVPVEASVTVSYAIS